MRWVLRNMPSAKSGLSGRARVSADMTLRRENVALPISLVSPGGIKQVSMSAEKVWP